jgi:hypothetical protein
MSQLRPPVAKSLATLRSLGIGPTPEAENGQVMRSEAQVENAEKAGPSTSLAALRFGRDDRKVELHIRLSLVR